MNAVEMYYTVNELTLLLRLCERTIRSRIQDGSFGAGVVNVGGPERADYRVPASGINAYLASRRIFSDRTEPTAARTEGELRRKVAA